MQYQARMPKHREGFTKFAAFHDGEQPSINFDRLANSIIELLKIIAPGDVVYGKQIGDEPYELYVGHIKRKSQKKSVFYIFKLQTLQSYQKSETNPVLVSFVQFLESIYNLDGRELAWEFACAFLRASYLEYWDAVEHLQESYQNLNHEDFVEQIHLVSAELCCMQLPTYEEAALVEKLANDEASL